MQELAEENRRNKKERIEVQQFLEKSSVLVRNEKQSWQNIVNAELKNDVLIRRMVTKDYSRGMIYFIEQQSQCSSNSS